MCSDFAYVDGTLLIQFGIIVQALLSICKIAGLNSQIKDLADFVRLHEWTRQWVSLSFVSL